MNKTNKILYGFLGLILYVAVMVGFGFLLNLFWKVTGGSATMYWVTTGVVCACVAFYVLLLLFTKKDKGVGGIQLFFTILLSLLPLVVRVINLIPVAGIYISAVLLFICAVVYLFTMLSMGYYATDINKDNRPGGTEI